jgi:rhamnosyltransferase
MNYKFGLIIPTLNFEGQWSAWIESFKMQTLKPAQVLIVDSSSVDRTIALSQKEGFETRIIPRNEFDHGKTRQIGADLLKDMPVIVFMTQDAVFADKYSLEKILDCLEDPKTGGVYGRQLPLSGAIPIAVHARAFNYPPVSYVRSKKDIPTIGLKSAFFSDSFSAYRKTALISVGGFPDKIIFGEDSYVATKMLLSGWQIKYCAEAQVFHSHNYGLLNDFRRYFDAGVLHSNENKLFSQLGKAEGEGINFVISELKYLSKNSFKSIPAALLRTFLKYAGYKAGKMHAAFPLHIKKFFSLNQTFWNKQ